MGCRGQSELWFLPLTVPPGIVLPLRIIPASIKDGPGHCRRERSSSLLDLPLFYAVLIDFSPEWQSTNYGLGFYFLSLYQPWRLKIRPTPSTFIWENMQAVQVGLRKESHKAEGDKRDFWINHFTGGRLLEDCWKRQDIFDQSECIERAENHCWVSGVALAFTAPSFCLWAAVQEAACTIW